MKKFFYYLLFAIFMAVFYFFLKNEFPKEVSRFPLFVGLLVMDIYLWKNAQRFIFAYSNTLRRLLTILFWLPFLSLPVIAIAAIISPISEWNDALRTYSIGAIFTVYAAKFVPLIFLLLADLIRFGKYIFHKFRKTTSSSPTSGISRLNFLKKLGFAGGGLMLATMFTGMVKWVYDFKIHDVKVRIPNLASAFNNYKIVQLSDMHLGSWASMRSMHELIDIINKLKPDLIVFTGDLVNYATPEAYRFKKSLSQLKAKDGIYAILGNHDYGDYTHWDSKEAKAKNLQNLVDFYQDIRWNLLRNNAVHIQKGQDSFVLAGVENWGNALRFPKYGDLNKTFENIDNTNKATILLSHDPSHWEAQVLKFEKQIDLMLAGHTHGMQFGVEIPGIKWSPAKWIYKQWGGLYKQKNALGNDGLLYVNRGIGSIGYPGRVGILPEITLIALETGS